MTTRTQKFIVPGKPVPLARPRLSHGLVYDSQREEKHQFKLELLAQRELPLFTKPIIFTATFYMPMPYKWSKKRRQQNIGQFHYARTDLDNLVKFVLDCCNEIVIQDDALVSVIICKKIYDMEPRTEFTLTEVQCDITEEQL